VINLCNAPLNQPCEITTITANDAFVDHLYSLGLIPGAEIKLFAKIAFGGPVAVSLRGSRIALRRQDAACIGVRAIAN
jgi:Fe2+ transport system protein FeoA